MSEATARHTRRDLRRAFGSDAVELIDKHAEQIGLTAQIAGELAQRLKRMEARMNEPCSFCKSDQWTTYNIETNKFACVPCVIAQAARPVELVIGNVRDEVWWLRDRNLWGRLRWLVTGR